MRYFTRLRVVLLITAAAALTLLTGCLPAEEEPLTPPVMRAAEFDRPQTVAVQRADLINRVKITCNYKPLSVRTYSFKVDGVFIEKVCVELGDYVTEGQLLAELDRSDLIEQLADAEAAVKQAELNCRRTKNTAAALKQLEIAQLKLDEIREREAKRYIFSENNGKVTLVQSYNVDSRSSTIETVVIVSDKSSAAYSAGASGEDLLIPRQSYVMVINDTKYPVECFKEDSMLLFYPDIPVEEAASFGYIEIETERSDNALYVPNRAVKETNEGYAVYVLNDAGLRTQVPVEIGMRVSGRTEIIGGLEEGDEVIVE